MSEEVLPYGKPKQAVDAERIETLAETMAELLVAIDNLHKDLAAIREAQERSAEVMRLHGGQLDALTAAIERLGGMLVRAAGERLQ